MEEEAVREYLKLGKVNLEDKYQKAVTAIVESNVKRPRKISMNISSKEFFPKRGRCGTKSHSGSFDSTSGSFETIECSSDS